MRIVALQQESRGQDSQDVVVGLFKLIGQQLIEDDERDEGDQGMASDEARNGRHFPSRLLLGIPVGWDGIAVLDQLTPPTTNGDSFFPVCYAIATDDQETLPVSGVKQSD